MASNNGPSPMKLFEMAVDLAKAVAVQPVMTVVVNVYSPYDGWSNQLLFNYVRNEKAWKLTTRSDAGRENVGRVFPRNYLKSYLQKTTGVIDEIMLQSQDRDYNGDVEEWITLYTTEKKSAEEYTKHIHTKYKWPLKQWHARAVSSPYDRRHYPRSAIMQREMNATVREMGAVARGIVPPAGMRGSGLPMRRRRSPPRRR
jgi:hypothetical protein